MKREDLTAQMASTICGTASAVSRWRRRLRIKSLLYDGSDFDLRCLDVGLYILTFPYTIFFLPDYLYLRQGGYSFIGVYLFVCLLAGLPKNSTDFQKNSAEKWHMVHGRND